jgi:hypothetical protein
MSNVIVYGFPRSTFGNIVRLVLSDEFAAACGDMRTYTDL